MIHGGVLLDLQELRVHVLNLAFARVCVDALLQIRASDQFLFEVEVPRQRRIAEPHNTYLGAVNSGSLERGQRCLSAGSKSLSCVFLLLHSPHL